MGICELNHILVYTHVRSKQVLTQSLTWNPLLESIKSCYQETITYSLEGFQNFFFLS